MNNYRVISSNRLVSDDRLRPAQFQQTTCSQTSGRITEYVLIYLFIYLIKAKLRRQKWKQ